MKVETLKLPGLLLFSPIRFEDARGYFVETWHKRRYEEAGLLATFVQDNLSFSSQNILRGLHFQNPQGQGKLVTVLQGEVFDVAVDIRIGSATFGEWVGVTLSSENGRQFYVPPGFAHGFCIISEQALFSYKCTEFYHPKSEQSLSWNDPDIGIRWPIDSPKLSEKDKKGLRLRDFSEDSLPLFFEDFQK